MPEAVLSEAQNYRGRLSAVRDSITFVVPPTVVARHWRSMHPLLIRGTPLTPPEWSSIRPEDKFFAQFTATRVKAILDASSSPWKSIESLHHDVVPLVMEILQTEMNRAPPVWYHAKCMKCLLHLGQIHGTLPQSFLCANVEIEGSRPVCGGGFADIWKGTMSQQPVCLKVLRIFTTDTEREELVKAFCEEALMWKQLHHPNILPFLGVSLDLFHPSFCLISPWMANGNLITFLSNNPTHDRLQCVIEVAKGIDYLHRLDPPIVHADIRGVNILVKDDLSCALADFGISLMVETRVPGSTTLSRGTTRWLPPEMMDHTLLDPSRLTARDIYSFGCTIIEIYTGRPPFAHLKSDAAVINAVLIQKTVPPRPPVDEFPSDELWFLVLGCFTTAPRGRPSAYTLLKSLNELKWPSHHDSRLYHLESHPDAIHLNTEPQNIVPLGQLQDLTHVEYNFATRSVTGSLSSDHFADYRGPKSDSQSSFEVYNSLPRPFPRSESSESHRITLPPISAIFAPMPRPRAL